MRLRRTAAASALAVAIVFGSAGSANALKWNHGDPLEAKGYGSYGWGYGNWKVNTQSDGTRSRLGANVSISNADNHKVFAKLATHVNAGYCVSPQFVTCSSEYYLWAEADTARHDGYSWAYKTSSTSLPGNADYTRAGIQVRLDIPSRPDIGSGWTWTKGKQY